MSVFDSVLSIDGKATAIVDQLQPLQNGKKVKTDYKGLSYNFLSI